MPFFNHSMAQSMRKSSTTKTAGATTATTAGAGASARSNKQIRSMPGQSTSTTADAQQSIARSADPSISAKYTQKISQRKLLFTRSLLRSQIEQLNAQDGPLLVRQAPKAFQSYQIDMNNRLNDDSDSNNEFQQEMYPAKNVQMPEYIMMARIIRNVSGDSLQLYLKILRHLGRKHPYIVNTWEIFADDSNPSNTIQIYIFQEFVPRGNMLTYVEMDNQPITERQLCLWSKQLYRALDFLGDSGIAHRSIRPNHLLLKPMGNELCIKLTGFKNSIIYWNIDENDINFCQCLPLDRQRADGPNFQAPEVYGNPNEYYDPICADIWSFGSNLFFILTRYYPYNMDYPHANLDDEIWFNITKIPGISQELRSFLFSLMRSNANDRIPFDFIDKDDWFRSRSFVC